MRARSAYFTPLFTINRDEAEQFSPMFKKHR
jgi:hypothetical protein